MKLKVIKVCNRRKQWFLAERGILPISGDNYYADSPELQEALTDYSIACNAFGATGVYAINRRRDKWKTHTEYTH